MRRLYRELQSQIHYMIILPYIVLMIIVMLIGSGIAITLVADNWQERFNNQLGQVARNFSESFAQREIGNITYLRQIEFTAPNQVTGAPSVVDAMHDLDSAGLELAFKGLWQVGLGNENVDQDRLIVFDTRGVSLLDWERSPENANDPIRYVGTSLSDLPLVKAVLGREQTPIANSDTLGDKYSGLIAFRSKSGTDNLYFFTVAPVYLSNADTTESTLVGGLLVAQRLDTLLQFLQNKSQSAISTIYDVNGVARATTVTGVDPMALDLDADLINQVAALNAPVAGAAEAGGGQRTGDAEDPCLDIGNLTGRLVTPLEATRLPTCSVNTTTVLADREYQVVYAPLLIRGVQSGYFAVGLSRDFVVSAWSSSRSAVLAVTAVLAMSAVFLGYYVARRITLPLGDLVDTAAAVTSGDLARRSHVADVNELGQLSTAFNQMTEHLLRLYTASRELNRTIEIDEVLSVVSAAAASFVPDTEALALIAADDLYLFRVRPEAPAPLRALVGQQLAADHVLLTDLATHGDQESRVLPIADAELRTQVGLGVDVGVQMLYVAPLFRQRRFSGALLFALSGSDPLDEAQQQSLAVIANMAQAVLSNAVLYAQVQQDAKQRQAILTSISDGVVVCDERGQIVLLNRAAEQILGRYDWQHSALRFADLPLEQVEQRREVFGQGRDEQFRLGERFITLSRAPVVAEDSQALGEVIVLHDVTEAVAIDKAKTDFIATISHELRTPLTVIRGFTELLLRGRGDEALTADQSDLLGQVRARAVDMTNMVNNAIMIADIESGQLQTDLQPQDVELVLSMAMAPLRQGFESKNIAVNLDLPPDLPPVLADREQLKRAFGQILDNAMRYTDAGSVTVRASLDARNNIQVDIIDTGHGISSEMLPMLFKRFQRVEGNNSAQRGGGLGLAITRQLIDRHGGSVGVVSTPGQGSTFTITLLQANEHSLAVAQSNGSTASS
ncbi:HAMP domain-containing protein [Oscillochloris sp. ZM17-4]|uniref:ATP-binding protein n=1 Tax=Oscillochloris sp. ZM17-4 TaxID=2866714 RepID=UPI001C72AE9C|nr:ATP-binding protein [Oscillochloris sp. ZM17-4]MBX0326799.1 HAMP domain-containing protein [Oscillochloris sp. ZM17-4]